MPQPDKDSGITWRENSSVLFHVTAHCSVLLFLIYARSELLTGS